jgi:2-oxoglutarate dehydrogenase E2 component (dihydrolipoamide succinyltransferase)
MPFFMKACAQALTEFVEVNAYIDGDEIVYNKNVHMGIAVSTPKGLVVPVIRDINTMSLVEMTRNMNALAEKGRDGKLSISDMAGGTFTITNGGVFGSMLSTPILNPPQSAILGLHNIVDRAVVVGGKIEIRPIMYLALSYDHRIIDGKDSVQFLVRVKELVEDPSLFILGA